MVTVEITVNGQLHKLEVDCRTSLLDLLRDNLQLSGTKKGCDHGQCGACTVLAGDRRINSCLTFALMYNGASITTIEGLGNPECLHPMQQAFIEHDGFQCGYCTPGQICSAIAMLREFAKGDASVVSEDIENFQKRTALTDDEIKERMSGNLCRCGAYSGIVSAIKNVAALEP